MLTDTFRSEEVTSLSITIAIDEGGAATSAPSLDRDLEDTAIGDVGAGTGIVGPEGMLWLFAPYHRLDAGEDVGLTLFGRLAPAAAEPAGGRFFIGLEPLIQRSGTWTTMDADRIGHRGALD